MLNLAQVQRGEPEFPLMDPYPTFGPFAVRRRTPHKPAAARWQPESPKVEWTWSDGLLTATVPRCAIHGMLMVEGAMNELD
jgi:hypothetical protein